MAGRRLSVSTRFVLALVAALVGLAGCASSQPAFIAPAAVPAATTQTAAPATSPSDNGVRISYRPGERMSLGPWSFIAPSESDWSASRTDGGHSEVEFVKHSLSFGSLVLKVSSTLLAGDKAEEVRRLGADRQQFLKGRAEHLRGVYSGPVRDLGLRVTNFSARPEKVSGLDCFRYDTLAKSEKITWASHGYHCFSFGDPVGMAIISWNQYTPRDLEMPAYPEGDAFLHSLRFGGSLVPSSKP